MTSNNFIVHIALIHVKILISLFNSGLALVNRLVWHILFPLQDILQNTCLSGKLFSTTGLTPVYRFVGHILLPLQGILQYIGLSGTFYFHYRGFSRIHACLAPFAGRCKDDDVYKIGAGIYRLATGIDICKLLTLRKCLRVFSNSKRLYSYTSLMLVGWL